MIQTKVDKLSSPQLVSLAAAAGLLLTSVWHDSPLCSLSVAMSGPWLWRLPYAGCTFAFLFRLLLGVASCTLHS